MSSKTLVELFAHSVRHHPEAAAVSDDDQRLSYSELDARSDRLAHRLVALGVGREDRVAVHLRRGVDVVVAVLGVLKAGAAYLPIDTRYADGRRDYMITEGRVRLVITHPDLAADLPDVEVLHYRDEPATGGSLPSPSPSDAACVLYTSGSTGQPKAIVLEHRQLVAFTLNPALPEMSPDDRTAQVASISFDPANFEIWCTLAAGAELVVLPSIPELLESDLQRELKRRKITVMLAPAIAINHAVKVDRDSFAPLRILHSGGDVLLPSSCRDLLASKFSGRLFNLYGPAETTTACTAYEVKSVPDDAESVPIGSAFAGYHLYVLDEDFKQVPVGSPGELYVGGAGVSRGYLNRPELTADKFVPDPFAADGGAMYRTGDRVRDRGDGVLEYLGRVDTQVKIRGYRVEPGEVERAICANSDVREAAVIAVGEPGDKRLVAFLVPAVDTLSLRELRADLSQRVADFLVPSEFIVLPAMPTDAHGKRDWEDLGHTASSRMRQRPDYVAPRTETEQYLADLWERLLTVEHVGVHDDFFVLGGHSLLAVRVRSLVRKELGVTLKPRAVFESSELSELAALVDRTREEVLIS
ncbi:non-ribosomal peptide synthetase [Lentzea sp. NBRC 105346]|uniref:non-ribosomal peptide synthetase n=1 Tax=Lentzea sp. NBRC 105346 TaxID=3032205 RepID=UPI002556BA48|nr:non-ribosomal peptide synthetase [Lentzea sp. NBRC 105346]